MSRSRWNPEGGALWPLVWRDTRWPAYVVAAHAALGLAADAFGILPVRQYMRWNGHSLMVMLRGSLLLLAILLVADLLCHRSFSRVQRRYLTARSAIGVGVVCLFVAQEGQMHEAFKRFIGRPENPFRWDATFSHISILLHGGVPAWRWLDYVFHPAARTQALDLAYFAWFPVIFYMGCLIAWLPRRGLRTRALCCWGFIWIGLGTVLAQLFSSAGPVYYHHVVAGPDPYAPLMAHLAAVSQHTPIIALQIQDALWANLPRAKDLAWLHISAFPSLHVALPAFFALVTWRLWRPLGVALVAFTAIILMGSIYLGWHYPIDGYLSILAVIGCWWLAGRLIRQTTRRSAKGRTTPLLGRIRGRPAP
jgi:hypothetical protein